MNFFYKKIAAVFLTVLLTKLAVAQQPNIVLIIADDHRWDATSYMQDRMLTTNGRTARFPWLDGTTPNLDRLSSEGVHFDNAFTVFSTCSPSRATMLSGVYPHIHGVTNNSTPFPTDITTYASLLRESNYTTGYFGKWHHGRQTQRPGFDEVVTFHGQGTYFSTQLYNGQNTLIRQTSSTEWIDDVSTSYAIDFINNHANSADPFMLVLGFKTPHQPFDPPFRTENNYNGEEGEDVPNLDSAPPGKSPSNNGNAAWDLRNYMRTIAGIDQCVGQILDRLEALNISDNTAVIYISDNGFFRGEHSLGDKRAPYEESIRIPLMIRYPNVQSSPRIVNEMALNLDIASTILDIAGLPIPEHMQGVSLLPLIANQTPSTWRSSFFYQYNHDPEFPTAAARPYIALRHENGLKLVNYEENDSWAEFFDTNTSEDPYEINNLISSSSHSHLLSMMETILTQKINESEFIKTYGINTDSNNVTGQVKLGDTYNFNIETSADLTNWTSQAVVGNGEVVSYNLLSNNIAMSEIVVGDENDYEIREGNNGNNFIENSGNPLEIGSYASWEPGSNIPGIRNAVLIFEMPPAILGYLVDSAELEIFAYRQYNPGNSWAGDLYTLGVYDTNDAIDEFSEPPSNNPNVVELDTGLLKFGSIPTLSQGGGIVKTPHSSKLSDYIRAFYIANPDYTGGKFIFLRINPSVNPNSQAAKFFILSANETNIDKRPKLTFNYIPITAPPNSLHFRVRYGSL